VTFCPLSVLPARGPTVSGGLDTRGPPRLPCVLFGREALAPGLADDRMATGFEADPGLKGIEIAVECVAQGKGNADGEHTGGLIAFGTSSGPRGLQV